MKVMRGYAFILAATAFWGVSATIARFLFSQNVSTLILVQTRMTFSFIVMFGIFFFARRDLLRIRAKDLYRFALMGIIGGAGSNFTYYYTIQQINVASAILLQYLAPIGVLVHASLSGEERVGTAKAAAGIVSLAGCFLAIAGKDFSLLSINPLGLASGLASAFCWAFANVWLRRLLKDYNVWTCLFYAFLFATVFWLFFNPPWTVYSAKYSSGTWLSFFGFAMISVLIPHSLYFLGVRYLTASRAIITATFEPVVAIVSAFLVLDETLAPVQMFGAVLVIVAIVLLQLKKEESAILSPVPPISHSE
ncbi:MAG TPA: EamA family transporter [Bacteroidota bacterium]|nr:EamA family transporter [Bacteroidota bacterium]